MRTGRVAQNEAVAPSAPATCTDSSTSTTSLSTEQVAASYHAATSKDCRPDVHTFRRAGRSFISPLALHGIPYQRHSKVVSTGERKNCQYQEGRWADIQMYIVSMAKYFLFSKQYPSASHFQYSPTLGVSTLANSRV